MVLEETVSEGRRTPKGYNPDDGSSAFTASLGPGAITISQVDTRTTGQMTPSEVVKQVQEIRSHYSHEVQDSTLYLGYELNGASRRYSLPLEKLPISGATRWLLYGGRHRRQVTSTFILDMMRGAENMAGRPLSQTEAEGYACHASRRTMYSFATTISALGIGTGMAIYGRSTMKFPFRKPKPLEGYNNFPNRSLPVLRGGYAQAAWHITRTNVYILLSLALLAPLYSSMGDSAMMVGLYRDTRTHEITKSMADANNANGGVLRRHESNRTRGAQPTAQPGPAQENEEGFYNSSDQGAPNAYGDTGNCSGDTAYRDGLTDTGLLGDSQMQSREARQPSPSSFTGNPAFHKKPVRQPERDFDSSSDSDFIFDHASPTAGNDPDMSTGMSSRSGGGAWSRIRSGQSDDGNKTGVTPAGYQGKQSSSSKQLQQKSARDEYETRGDSFSFSSSEEEKQLAKEQAQKEFDKMLDEERKGVDNAGHSGGGSSGAWGRRRGE